MATYFYNALQVSCIFLNVLVQGGLDDGEFLTIVQDEDDYGRIIGTDGGAAIYGMNNLAAAMQLKLLQTSPTNDLFSTIRQNAITLQNGSGIGPFLVKDRLGTSLYRAKHCYIAKPPDVAFDRGVKQRVWTFGCTDLVRFDGGNIPV